MRRAIKTLYKIEFIMFLCIIVLFILHNDEYKNLFTIISFGILLFASTLLFKKKRDNNFFRDSAFRLVVAILLFYFILIFALGIFLGFSKTQFSLNVKTWFSGLIPTFLVILITEYLRFILVKNNSTNKKGIYSITILMILFNIAFNIGYSSLNSTYTIFICICMIVLPAIAQELLGSYLVLNYGFLPAITYKLCINLYIYLIPIFPDLGNYLYSCIQLLMPFTIYILLNKYFKLNDEIQKKRIKRINTAIITTPLIVFLIALIVLVSGIFNYQLIAIASNSMVPVYYRGDTIIFEKVKDLSDIKVGEILVFKNNNLIIAHRVVKIRDDSGKLSFYTQGDANNSVDSSPVSEENVLGVGKCVIKYIGYPTVLLNEFLKE